MEITFLRKGFANNSSSSHSIIFSDDLFVKDEVDDDYYGWDFFTATSKSEKLRYWFSTFYHNYVDQCTVEVLGADWGSEREYVFKGFLNYLRKSGVTVFDSILNSHDGDDIDGLHSYIMGIDHQSVFAFPCTRNRKDFNVDFVNEFVSECVNKNYHILGGNDNTDESHKYKHKDDPDRNALHEIYRMALDRNDFGFVCEKDHKTGEFVVSNFRNGNLMKIRIG